ncbi:hypothetical protein ASD97_37385 [Streptomyces sp. Root63]|uniref:hypothetical protein n=1 Tax=unclassified Streptomyces TaxID=2593676 RepID=UPI0006FC6274|nr:MULTISPECIES: hypothetical protein [unclassified Streptomyces]KQX32216.1 hypothetical protein ASD29_15575 [Streptomyces sp. Root1295]KRA47074.1 hypothetical protein ASD97_37385 [Streptomyces sp. Root63]
MKPNPNDGGKYSVALNGVFSRTMRYLQVCLKKAEQRPFDLGYEALRGAAYKAGGGLATVVIAWMATRR